MTPSHRSRKRREQSSRPSLLYLGLCFTAERVPIRRVTVENQELKAILNELSK